MSRSDYKNIYEGYLDNTGYNNRRVAERYGSCGSEPMPYEMNEKPVMENYTGYNNRNIRERYGGCGSEPMPYVMNEIPVMENYNALPDCGTLGTVVTGWTACKDTLIPNHTAKVKNQTTVYNFNLEDKYKNNSVDELKTLCKIPLPADIKKGLEGKVTANFGNISVYNENFGDNTPSKNLVVFDNSCTPNRNGWTETRQCNIVKSNPVEGYANKSFVSKDTTDKIEYKSTVEINDTKCRKRRTDKWVKDAFNTICSLPDYVSTNYYLCEKKDGGNDTDHRERCCRSNVTSRGHCNFWSSPCKNFQWGRSYAANAAVNDLGGVQYGFQGMNLLPIGSNCTNHEQCPYSCINGKCSN
jgi:hypothetical protein